MNTTLDRMALGEIAVLLPGASAIFRRYGMDFCCGGDVLLADAVKEPGVALEQIVAELRALDQSAPRAYPEEPGALMLRPPVIVGGPFKRAIRHVAEDATG